MRYWQSVVSFLDLPFVNGKQFRIRILYHLNDNRLHRFNRFRLWRRSRTPSLSIRSPDYYFRSFVFGGYRRDAIFRGRLLENGCLADTHTGDHNQDDQDPDDVGDDIEERIRAYLGIPCCCERRRDMSVSAPFRSWCRSYVLHIRQQSLFFKIWFEPFVILLPIWIDVEFDHRTPVELFGRSRPFLHPTS